VPVTADRPSAIWEWFLTLGPLEDSDVVAGIDQPRDEKLPDEAGAADDEDAHIR
jgi:hypothetical protein